jgi:predicted ribosome quality control (RQC) complex YloA/Tae2 family protein
MILRFAGKAEPFLIKASLQPELSCLSFPVEFDRANKNSANLFEGLIGKAFTHVNQYNNERSFLLGFSEHFELLFKMHGSKANILLFEQGILTDQFRTQLRESATVLPGVIDRHIDWSFDHFISHHDHLRETYFTLGKVVWNYLEDKGFSRSGAREQFEALLNVKNQLEKGGHFYLTTIDDSPVLSLLDTGAIRQTFTDPVEAVNSFFSEFTRTYALNKEKRRALAALSSRLASVHNTIATSEERLKAIKDHSRYRLWADLIMANLNQISFGQMTALVPDLYHDGQMVEIKLKKDLSPQKNAEVYYAKSKNELIESKYLESAIENKTRELDEIDASIQLLKTANDLRTLRRLIKDLPTTAKRKKEGMSLPYQEFVFMGFRLLVGKNAAGNDQLVTRHSYKEDLWLHARDVSGSHVIIKYQAGKKFPERVIERAAQLAAFHSKRKNDTLCPVVYTPRKFVRKKKGDPPGVVVVEREQVIMVEPKK